MVKKKPEHSDRWNMVLFAIIFIFAALVRLYDISAFASFGSETAQHYLQVKKILAGEFLVEGPYTSHPWFRLGALPYYLLFPILLLTGFHPLTLYYTSVITGILAIAVNYFVIKKILKERVALISTLLFALSPFNLMISRIPGLFNFITPFIFVLILLIHKTLHDRKFPYWPIYFITGIIVNFHAAVLILLPLILAFQIYVKKKSAGNLITGMIAFLIPNIPFLLQDYAIRFSMIRNLILWIPYKLINFLSGTALGVNKVMVKDETFGLIMDFIKINFIPARYSFMFGLIFFSVLVFLSLKSKGLIRIISIWLFAGIGILFIHKNPPIHYFLPLYPLPVIIVAYWITQYYSTFKTKILIGMVMTVFLLINMQFIFSPDFLFKSRQSDRSNPSYSTQEKIARLIIDDIRGNPFSISRIGLFDQYENEFKENYTYLLWWLGNEPVEKSDTRYLIVEDLSRFPDNNGYRQLAEIQGIRILKK